MEMNANVSFPPSKKQSYNLQVTNYKLNITSHKLQLKIASCNLQFTSYSYKHAFYYYPQNRQAFPTLKTNSLLYHILQPSTHCMQQFKLR
jgi:hypothetical protein